LQTDAEQPAARLQWARQRCDHFLAHGKQAKAIELAIAHNLVCQGTSFVAWDEVEKISMAKREVYQPSLDVSYSMAAPPLQSPRRGSTKVKSMAAPAVPGRQTNFFEGRVTDYQKASMLQECSDDDLLADIPALAVDDEVELCQSADTPTTCFKISAPKPDDFDQELKRLGIPAHFRILYNQVNDTAPADLPAWALPLRNHLIAAGISQPIADMLVSILIQWAGEVIGQQRHKRVAVLVGRMLGIETHMDELIHFLDAQTQDQIVKDVKQVLAALAVSSAH
jgi:hypothetical protein